MDVITDVSSLKQRISHLEQKRDFEKDSISAELTLFKESLKPANLIRRVIGSVQKSPELKADLMHGVVGIATGFLTNKVLLGSVRGPFKRILATLVQAGITNAAVKYPVEIKSKVISALTGFLQAIKFKSDDEIHIRRADEKFL